MGQHLKYTADGFEIGRGLFSIMDDACDLILFGLRPWCCGGYEYLA